MRRRSYQHLIFAGVFILSLAGLASGQSPDQPAVGSPPAGAHNPDGRGNVLRELGLTREQVQDIRRINQERRSALEAAGRRLREANRALDDAIYADTADDPLIKSRLSDLQSAQSEAASLRFEKELAIRRILTPEQLIRFRNLRRNFEELRRTMDERRRDRREFRNGPSADAAQRPAVRQMLRQNNARPRPQ
ncbi:MAG: periplasmic heavy metal sensor [Blastocatellia bacterium]|nr:periplasmic heavy metal sensor [Blastocatellia bacterium]